MKLNTYRCPSWHKGYKHRFKRDDNNKKRINYYNHDEYDDHCYMNKDYFTLGFIDSKEDGYHVCTCSDNGKNKGKNENLIGIYKTEKTAKKHLINILH